MRGIEFHVQCHAKKCESYNKNCACENIEIDEDGFCTEYFEASPIQCECGKHGYPGEFVHVSFSKHKVCSRCAKAGKIQ